MSRVSTSRLLARNVFTAPRCIASSAPQWTRLFTTTSNLNAPPPKKPNAMDSLAKNALFAQSMMKKAADPTLSMDKGFQMGDDPTLEPYHFHIYSHKHNTHITVSDPNRDALISMSCGQLGLKNAQRKSYDAAYQLAAFVVDKLHQKGIVKKIHKLEVILRGFGPGREAAVKVLLGTEGKMLKPLITRVTDSTRVKFGGTRSQKKRRLG